LAGAIKLRAWRNRVTPSATLIATRCDRIWRNAHLATMAGTAGDELGVIRNGLVASRDGRIVYAGPEAGANVTAVETIDCEGRWITPGLIDCHTHLVYGGDRADEFRRRQAGESYEDIARSGGGIVSTMRATRAATEAELLAQSLPRLDALIAEGATTVEIKSGYGLNPADELKQLRVAQQLGRERDVRIAPTLLSAHTLPPEYAGRPDAYIDEVCNEIIPSARGLATAVDIFCERIAFTTAQAERVFAAASANGMRVKIHAEQLSNQHGAETAARHNALSADHLEHLDEAGAAAMAKAGTVAVLLPGAFYFTREAVEPPVDMLRRHAVTLALATDCNPGTSPLTSLLLTMNMGAVLFGLTIDECLLGVTRNAARALGLDHETGALETGKACDLAIWNIGRPEELVFRIGLNPLHARVREGRIGQGLRS
jgi:imidazolonepropionase